MPFASINPANQRTNLGNWRKIFLRIGAFEKLSFFEVAILDLFFKKKKLLHFYENLYVKGFWISRMGQNFDDYPDFQPKITHLKHFSRQYTLFKSIFVKSSQISLDFKILLCYLLVDIQIWTHFLRADMTRKKKTWSKIL